MSDDKTLAARKRDLAAIAGALAALERAYANLNTLAVETRDRDTFRYAQNLREKLEHPRKELEFMSERVSKRITDQTPRVN